MIAMVYDHSHPTELHVKMCNGHPQESSHLFQKRINLISVFHPKLFFLVEFSQNCLAGWKEKRLTDAGVSSFPILCPSYVNLNVPAKMYKPSINYKGEGIDRVLFQIVS